MQGRIWLIPRPPHREIINGLFGEDRQRTPSSLVAALADPAGSEATHRGSKSRLPAAAGKRDGLIGQDWT